MSTPTDPTADRLAAIEAKLDRLLAAQAEVDELVEDGLQIAKAGVSGLTPWMAELEAKGWFALGEELFGVMDAAVQGYTREDVRLLGENVVAILDTVRNLTQPDILDLANAAGDAVHHADEAAPIGPFGVLKAAREEDVQRGFAVLLEVVRRVGEASGKLNGVATPTRRAAPPPAVAAPRATPLPAPIGASPPETKRAIKGPANASTGPTLDANKVPQVAGATFDAKGFLADPAAWTPELGAAIAADLGLDLTDEHWEIVSWIRTAYADSGSSPNVRAISKGSGTEIKDLYRLFPGGPGKLAAKVAGVPKPAGCL